MNDLTQVKKEQIKKLKSFAGEFPSRNSLRKLPNITVGDIYWLTLENQAYIVTSKEGTNFTLKALDEHASISLGISIYDFNKGIASKQPILTAEELKTTETVLKDWVTKTANENYLLYGREIHSISIFRVKHKDVVLYPTIYQTLSTIGDIISIDCIEETEKNPANVEIWIRTDKEKATLLYLIPYDNGIIII